MSDRARLAMNSGAAPPGGSLLLRLLAGEPNGEFAAVDARPPFPSIPPNESRLPEVVGAALASPDIGLIHDPSGDGVAETVAQCAKRGERVILLVPDSDALDRCI